MAQIEIDGKQLEVDEGSTIIDAADALGIYIPRFCYHKKLSVAANCRMCLVEVEESKKPVPACATPVTEGMKIFTVSRTAKRAQRGVMEFLLINHPLDCPICDQGGECELQDLAVGYGNPASRYTETKRVVVNKNLGPLISTDMTRCIHCTRCVRFGVEIGGIMEMGQTGRGEHSEIGTYVKKAVASELSGNMIDLCPVGALTSKPFRYSARTWELVRRPSVAPHDGLGANITVHVKNNHVMRVLPRDNEAINECWLSDRDRFSYEGLNSEDRLKAPMIKQGGEWHEVDWQTALDYVAHGLKDVRAAHGTDAIGALVHPSRTLEEMYLAQKLVRGLGSGNIDSRLRQADGRVDALPWLGMPVEQVSGLDGILVVGAALRKEQPLLAQRVRQAVKAGAAYAQVSLVDDDLLMPVAASLVVKPSQIVVALASVVGAVAAAAGKPVPETVAAVCANVVADDAARAAAAALLRGERRAVFLGALAQHHPDYAVLHALAAAAASLSGATLGVLVDAANATGAHLAGCVPTHGPLGAPVAAGRDISAMVAAKCRAWLLLDVEPAHDLYDGAAAVEAIQAADMVVVMSPFKGEAAEYADVLLPVSPFTETSGSFVSMEGRLQPFAAVVKPLGETRPAWKVLRVLGNLLDVPGFNFDSSEAVRADLLGQGDDRVRAALETAVTPATAPAPVCSAAALERVGDVPAYGLDALTRRAEALQATPEARGAEAAWANAATLAAAGLADGDQAVVRAGNRQATVTVRADGRLPDGALRLAAATAAGAALGALFGPVALERA